MADDLEQRAGLCTSCVHARRVTSARGSMFVLCGLSATDPRYTKYPPLPVVRCAGHTPWDAAAARSSDECRGV